MIANLVLLGLVLQAMDGLPSASASAPASAAYAIPVPATNAGMDRYMDTLLHDVDWTARVAAAKWLGLHRDPDAVTALITALQQDPSTDVRKAAADALAMIGTPKALNALSQAAITDPDDSVRKVAAADYAAVAGAAGNQTAPAPAPYDDGGFASTAPYDGYGSYYPYDYLSGAYNNYLSPYYYDPYYYPPTYYSSFYPWCFSPFFFSDFDFFHHRFFDRDDFRFFDRDDFRFFDRDDFRRFDRDDFRRFDRDDSRRSAGHDSRSGLSGERSTALNHSGRVLSGDERFGGSTQNRAFADRLSNTGRGSSSGIQNTFPRGSFEGRTFAGRPGGLSANTFSHNNVSPAPAPAFRGNSFASSNVRSFSLPRSAFNSVGRAPSFSAPRAPSFNNFSRAPSFSAPRAPSFSGFRGGGFSAPRSGGWSGGGGFHGGGGGFHGGGGGHR